MNGFKVLFYYGMKRRIKDSFLISYGVMFPLLLILILGYISTNYYSGENGITSYYYYALVTIPLCTFLSSITLMYVAREESLFKCGERFILSPVDRASIVLSKILPATISTTFYNFLLLLFCRFILKIDFKGKDLEMIVLLLILGFMSCAIGTFIGLCTKDFLSVKNLVSIPIMVMGILGGSFFPIASLGTGIEIISYFSPLTWINRGIFSMLNDNSMTLYILSVAIALVVGILFTIGAIIKFKKEAFI